MLDRVSYEQLIYTLPAHYPAIQLSTLVLAPPGLDTARLSGLLAFDGGIVLCVYEILDFQQGQITAYRYEVSRYLQLRDRISLPEAATYCRAHYPEKQKLYWYDSWPHPNTPELSATSPHHKHILPGLKHNRIPAPNLSFTKPNLPFLIQEVVALLDAPENIGLKADG